MADLSTNWLGFELATPLVMAASPLCLDADAVARAVDAGAAAVVLPSLFEVPDGGAPRHRKEKRSGIFTDEATPYVRQLERLKKRFDIPIIASLNATTPLVWKSLASTLESAGANAIELNLYELASTVERGASVVEAGQVEAASIVVGAVKIPVTAKLSMFYTSMPTFVANLMSVGVRGVAVFNRFYQPDIDVETLDVDRRLQLSTSSELPMRLHALASLYVPPKDTEDTPLWLACTGGVHTGRDAAKAILSGAHVVQLASALLRNGPEHLYSVRASLNAWCVDRGFKSINEARGLLSLHHVKDPDVWTRLNYVRQIGSWTPD
jgi:dihydroorotate dehydrogenase (fumarate)